MAFVQTFIAKPFWIPTGSMEPVLLVGDYILINRIGFSSATSSLERLLSPNAQIQRGDVVVLKSSVEPDRHLIKRVVALPGETVVVKNNKIHVNGKLLTEPYAHYSVSAIDDPPAGFEARVQLGFKVSSQHRVV